ncbi:ergothioneine biosynthesis protein EgtC [Nocardia camponoti]|uniref:Gamma-glutamyl-hercynylcysteine sulfoxide hydrolase n=1 Tax=Nocardia camponoti TaxID=1616106 RepID=A0A917V894_9NOCA|nr:ergothioneine biosynthesis protein EgtC [Nocardia camponoti]GGK48878.1 gamma-glutamyl-hercynylcysteine sulfoxide hydrolase [Nocardia camponoti]
MCRHLGYIGPPHAVGELLVRGPHSLVVQSFTPLEMRGGGTINADGFGVAWWRNADVGIGHERAAVTAYRNPAPIWTDPAVEEVLPQLESRSVVAAVRSATVGMPLSREACAPFTDDHWAFSHNGVVPDWRVHLPAAQASLDDQFAVYGQSAMLFDLTTLTDSAALWWLLRGLLAAITPDGPITSPAQALAVLTDAVIQVAPSSRLNLLLGNGSELWATTCYHSLSVLVADDYTVIASEPFDADPRWQAVPDRHLVVATPGAATITSLDSSVTERVVS